MKKAWKIVLIVSLALIILGAALFGVSMVTGGSLAALEAHGTVTEYFSSVLAQIQGFFGF